MADVVAGPVEVPAVIVVGGSAEVGTTVLVDV